MIFCIGSSVNCQYERNSNYDVEKITVIDEIRNDMGRLMTKRTKWHVHPAKTQISLGICPVLSESSLSAWRKLGSLATDGAHSEDADQTGRVPRLIWVFAGRTLILLILSCLIRVFAVRMKKARILSYRWSAQRRRWSDWGGGCQGWSESSLGAHSFCWFCHVVALICGSCLFALLYFWDDKESLNAASWPSG